VERLERLRELFVGEPKALEVLRVISEATMLLAVALDRFAVLVLVPDNGLPPITLHRPR